MNGMSDSRIYLSLYRGIIRGIAKLKKYIPVIELRLGIDPNLHNELTKAQINPQLYGNYLLEEIRFLTKEAFNKRLTNKNRTIIYNRVTKGADLIELLKHINGKDAEHWTRLIKYLVDFRSEKLRQSLWGKDFDKNRDQIEQGLLKDMPSIKARRISSEMNRRKARVKHTPFDSLSSGARTKHYKIEAETSEINASKVMKAHLKRLQRLGMIPNPFKLPYVTSLESFLLMNQPDQKYGIPGSGKSSIIRKAYDEDIINTIMAAEVEHRINEKHFLGRISNVVNKRGPAKVKIVVTNAGAMPASYLRTPRPKHKFMKAMAISIKRLMRCIRKQYIWGLTEATENAVSEAKHGEGYSVTGSKGYSFEEIMFPREYYEKLAVDESIWEFLMEKEAQKESGPDSRTFLLDRILKSWSESLDIASASIDKEMLLYFEKHRAITSKLRKKREQVQRSANMYHETVVKKYRKILTLIEKENVFLHSDLYNVKKTPQITYKRGLKADTKSKDKWGLPLSEKLGYTLGDYLVSVGLKGFRMGNNFKKRQNIVAVKKL